MSRPPRRPGRSRRDRHGRGLRGRLVPAEVPLARSRAEQFDDLVLDAVEDIERRWERELAGVEFAVEDVPWVEHTTPDEVVLDADVLDDGSVPLARGPPPPRTAGRPRRGSSSIGGRWRSVHTTGRTSPNSCATSSSTRSRSCWAGTPRRSTPPVSPTDTGTGRRGALRC